MIKMVTEARGEGGTGGEWSCIPHIYIWSTEIQPKYILLIIKFYCTDCPTHNILNSPFLISCIPVIIIITGMQDIRNGEFRMLCVGQSVNQ